MGGFVHKYIKIKIKIICQGATSQWGGVKIRILPLKQLLCSDSVIAAKKTELYCAV